MKKVFIHIGYPKALSTTLQRDYFLKHHTVVYGGVGNESDILGYYSSKVEQLFESGLKYENSSSWRNNLIVYRNAIKLIEESHCNKRLVFSSEHLALNFSFQGIDSILKYKRLGEVFNKYEINILLISREPISFIRSIYKEFVILGYDKLYIDFLKWLYTFRDRNFLLDLNLENKINQLKREIEGVQIRVLSFEELIYSPRENINREISDWLSHSNLNLMIEKKNESLSNEQIYSMVIFNKSHNHGISSSQDYPFEKHRNRIIYDQSKMDYKEKDIFSDVIVKREAKLFGLNNLSDNVLFRQEKRLSLEKKIASFINDK